MLPPITRNVHSPHASFSKASGSARQTPRSRFIAGLESSYIRGCAISESLNSCAFDQTETRGSRNYPRKLESGRILKRAELGLGALPASGADQHVDVVGSGATTGL